MGQKNGLTQSHSHPEGRRPSGFRRGLATTIKTEPDMVLVGQATNVVVGAALSESRR